MTDATDIEQWKRTTSTGGGIPNDAVSWEEEDKSDEQASYLSRFPQRRTTVVVNCHSQTFLLFEQNRFLVVVAYFAFSASHSHAAVVVMAI